MNIVLFFISIFITCGILKIVASIGKEPIDEKKKYLGTRFLTNLIILVSFVFLFSLYGLFKSKLQISYEETSVYVIAILQILNYSYLKIRGSIQKSNFFVLIALRQHLNLKNRI